MPADESKVLIYSSFTTEELEAEIARLKEQWTFYTAAGEGGMSYQKDLRGIENRLEAAILIQQERAGRGMSAANRANYFGTTDFSGIAAS